MSKSIDEYLIALEESKADIKSALENKGIMVGAGLVTYADAIEGIEAVDNRVVVPNGFRFTGGDISKVNFKLYNWEQVYDTSEFFSGVTNSTGDWSNFLAGFNGEILSCYRMFYNSTNLTSIPLLDTSNVTDMSSMFSSCNNLTSIPLLDTSNVTNMNSMFYYCSSLTSIPLLDTSKVASMSHMFYYCSKLTSIPLLDTSKVTDMNSMFEFCSSLTSIPLLDTSNVTNMNYMFGSCSNLTSIPHLDTSSVTDMSSMFSNCKNLTSIPQLDTSKVTNMGSMFYYCSNLTSIPLLDCSSITSTQVPFGYSNLNNLTDIGGFKDLKVSWSSYFLNMCPNASVESLMNVINNLYDLTANGISSKTIVFGSTNLAKLSDEQKAIATNKGWRLT